MNIIEVSKAEKYLLRGNISACVDALSKFDIENEKDTKTIIKFVELSRIIRRDYISLKKFEKEMGWATGTLNTLRPYKNKQAEKITDGDWITNAIDKLNMKEHEAASLRLLLIDDWIDINKETVSIDDISDLINSSAIKLNNSFLIAKYQDTLGKELLQKYPYAENTKVDHIKWILNQLWNQKLLAGDADMQDKSLATFAQTSTNAMSVQNPQQLWQCQASIAKKKGDSEMFANASLQALIFQRGDWWQLSKKVTVQSYTIIAFDVHYYVIQYKDHIYAFSYFLSRFFLKKTPQGATLFPLFSATAGIAATFTGTLFKVLTRFKPDIQHSTSAIAIKGKSTIISRLYKKLDVHMIIKAENISDLFNQLQRRANILGLRL